MKYLTIICFGFLLIVLSFGSAQSDTESDFEVIPFFITATLGPGSTFEDRISVINRGSPQTFTIQIFEDSSFISLFEQELFLVSGEEGVFDLLLSSEDLEPGIFVGHVLISSHSHDHRVPIILEVESEEVLFDATTEVADKFSSLSPGTNFVTDVSVHNLRSIFNNDVSLAYVIHDLFGNVVVSDSQSLTVPDRIKVTKTFLIPQETPFGEYVFSVIARQGNSVGVSSSLFRVAPDPIVVQEPNYPLFIAIGLIIVLVFAILIFNFYWSRTLKHNALHWKTQLSAIEKEQSSHTHKELRKLVYQKKVLVNAYRRGYITQRSYQEGIRAIDSSIATLKKRL